METTDNKKSNKILYEIRDMLTGAAFPIMLQLIFSTSIILFADYNEEPVLQVFVLVFGEILLAGAYVVFGRQNGLAAYRRTAKKSAPSARQISAPFTKLANTRFGRALS